MDDPKDSDIQEVMREEKSRGKRRVDTAARQLRQERLKLLQEALKARTERVCGSYPRAWVRRRPRETAGGLEDLAFLLLSLISATFNSNARHLRSCSSGGNDFKSSSVRRRSARAARSMRTLREICFFMRLFYRW